MSTAKKDSKPLQIIRLTITNFGIIRAAAIHPDGSPIVLAGDNGQGKSTVLNAIESVLYGRKLAEPVTKGQQKAQIKLELAGPGDTKAIYKIEQIIKKDDDGNPCYNLKILDADDKQVPSPVKFIESLILSGAALDPTEIMQPRAGERPETFAKRQAETLMERFGLSAKAKKLDTAIEEKAAERKKAKETVATLQARLDAIEVPPGTPDSPLDVGALANKISSYNGINTERSNLSTKLTSSTDTVRRVKEEMERAEKTLAESKARFLSSEKERAGLEETLAEFDDMNPPAGIQKGLEETNEKLQNANGINTAVTKKKERKQVSTELATAESEAADLHSEVEKLREDRLDLVRKAKLPVKGLELTADALLFNGKPLVQESTGNMTRVCAELAMAEEPDCRVVFIREAALLNKANKSIIYEVAAQRGYQCWCEEFSETPVDNALWISAGEVQES